MVAALAQLHHDVHQRGLCGAGAPLTGEEAHIALVDGPVPLLLYRRELDLHYGLLLRGDRLLDIRLHAPQQEGAHRLVERLHLLLGRELAEGGVPLLQ